MTYTIIAGINGAGKSSLSGVLRAERNDLGVIVDVDKLAVENNIGALEAGKLAVAVMREALAEGKPFTQETTLSGARTERFVREAKDRGYTIRLCYIGLNTAGESVKRIANRVAKGGHSIDSADVYRRFAKRFADLTRILPYCDEAVFFDNENGFAEVGEYRDGAVILKCAAAPDWLNELMDYGRPRA